MEDNCSNKICGDKKKLIARANRVEGQIRGIKRMIEEDNCSNKICGDKKKLIARANRVEGQIRGIKRMIEQEDLWKIIVQIKSVVIKRN